jgi:amino acid permease
MMTNDANEIPLSLPAPQEPSAAPADNDSSKKVIWIAVGVLVLILLLVGGIVALALASEETTARVRDIFIIFMALESLVLGAGLVILIVQVATLINMLQHEIKPIIESTNDTVNNLRGTTQFLSNNLVEPVMKMNEYLAGLKKFLDMMKFNRH